MQAKNVPNRKKSIRFRVETLSAKINLLISSVYTFLKFSIDKFPKRWGNKRFSFCNKV